MAIISIGQIDKKLIPILVGGAFFVFNRMIVKINEDIFRNHPIITDTLFSMTLVFNIIPFIILRRRSKNLHHNNISINTSEIILKKPQKYTNKDKWLYIFLLATIYFAQSILFAKSFSMKTYYWIFDIIFTPLFYYFIFKIKLFKHHYLSIIIILLTGLIIDLSFKSLQNDFSNNWISVLFRFIREVLFSLHNVVGNYIMVKKYVSEYELALYNGIIISILFCIFGILDYYFFNFDDYEQFFDNLNYIEILEEIGFMVSQLGIYLSYLFTSKLNTPCHIFIIYAFGQMANYFDFSLESIIKIICFIFILFMSLIFNEIIELNFCGLSDNTKRNISIRAATEDFEIDDFDKIDISDENYMIDSKELDKKDDDDSDINSKNIN